MKSMLLGPYELSFDSLARALPTGQCGAYALGHVDFEGTFRIERVCRDDRDLREHLQGLIGSSNRFKFAPARSPQQAFESECYLFHRFQPPNNIIHPDRPRGTNWRCPVCVQRHG